MLWTLERLLGTSCCVLGTVAGAGGMLTRRQDLVTPRVQFTEAEMRC